MGNLTSEPSVPAVSPKQSSFLTTDEQALLHQLYASIVRDSSVVAAFDATDKDIFRSTLSPYFSVHIHTYTHFEEFVVSCTRSTSDKIVGIFWTMVIEDKSLEIKEALFRLSQIILELSLPKEHINDVSKREVAIEMVNFFATNFFVHGVDVDTSHASITPLLLTALNNYLPHTHKALETYISRVCFQGMHSPSYKPFSAPSLEYPSEILQVSHLLPLALHSHALQGTWKRLYSTSTDGMSFNRIVYHSLGYDGPTCVLIKCSDAAGTVLGMLSHDHWKESNRFYGSSKNALFVLSPTLRVYRSKSGSNGAYQWLNSKSITHPRGMGFGGTVDGFRVFIPESLEGCTAANSCPTYETGKLIEGETFENLTLEVWGCGGADVVAAALAAQAHDRAITDETIRRARQVDKAQFFNNEFDKEFLLSHTMTQTSRDRTGHQS